MTERNVEQMRKQREQSEKVASIKENIEDKKIKQSLQPRKVKMIIKQHKPAQIQHKAADNADFMRHIAMQEHIQRMEEEREINNVVKELSLTVASKPIRRDKQQILYDNLKQSRIINNYIDNNIYMNYFNQLSNDIKAGLEYTRCYLSALNS